MDPKKNYYHILGISEGASRDQIKKAFRELAKKFHPDVNPGNEKAEKKFKEINEAHDVLSDEKKKAQYDAMRSGAFSPGGFSGFETSGGRDFSFDFGDIFSDLLGRSEEDDILHSRGRDMVMNARLSFEDAAKGTTMEIQYRRPGGCTTCDGMGVQSDGRSTCITCGGSGRVGKRTGFLNVAQLCDRCMGKGITGSRCPSCGGRGVKEADERIKVKIPPGAKTGTKIRVAGKGEAGASGGPPGDLYLQVQVEPHRFFRREGDDIYIDVPLNFSEAVLGATIDVPTIDGMVALKVPPGTGSGKKIRLKGKGVYRSDGRRGNQYVVVTVVVPEALDDELRKLVKNLSKWEDKGVREKLKD